MTGYEMDPAEMADLLDFVNGYAIGSTADRTVRDVVAAAAQWEFERSLSERRNVMAGEFLGYRIAAAAAVALQAVAGVTLDLDATVPGSSIPTIPTKN